MFRDQMRNVKRWNDRRTISSFAADVCQIADICIIADVCKVADVFQIVYGWNIADTRKTVDVCKNVDAFRISDLEFIVQRRVHEFDVDAEVRRPTFLRNRPVEVNEIGSG